MGEITEEDRKRYVKEFSLPGSSKFCGECGVLYNCVIICLTNDKYLGLEGQLDPSLFILLLLLAVVYGLAWLPLLDLSFA